MHDKASNLFSLLAYCYSVCLTKKARLLRTDRVNLKAYSIYLIATYIEQIVWFLARQMFFLDLKVGGGGSAFPPDKIFLGILLFSRIVLDNDVPHMDRRARLSAFHWYSESPLQ